MRHSLTLLAAAWLGLAPQAGACSFHVYLPERTVIDRLLETENVVLARAAEDDPFRFEAVEALEGTLEQAELPTLVDSVTRRRLAAEPQDAVLFARDGGAYGPFQRLAYVDAAYREVLTEVMARKPDWIMGDDLERYQFFADLLDHPSEEIRRLALGELDRANYDLLRMLDLSIDAEAIVERMRQPAQIPFLPIHILLLGLSGETVAREEVLRALRVAGNGSGITLGPYSVAIVEMDGPAGVDHLAEHFLAAPEIDGTALELVVEALAIHAGAAPEAMRTHILETLGRFAENRPDHADMIVRQFQIRYDFGMAPALQSLMENGKIRSARVLLPVATYVTTANAGLVTPGDIQ